MLLGGYFVGLLNFTWKINSCYTKKHQNEVFFSMHLLRAAVFFWVWSRDFFILTLKGLRVQPNNLHGVTRFPCFITEGKRCQGIKKDPSSNDFDLRETVPFRNSEHLFGESNYTQKFKMWLLGVHPFETQMTKNILLLKTHENTRCANHMNFNHKKLWTPPFSPRNPTRKKMKHWKPAISQKFPETWDVDPICFFGPPKNRFFLKSVFLRYFFWRSNCKGHQVVSSWIFTGHDEIQRWWRHQKRPQRRRSEWVSDRMRIWDWVEKNFCRGRKWEVWMDFSRELGAIFQRVGRYFEGVWFYISAFWRHYPVETQRTLSWTILHLEYHIHLFLHQFRVSCFRDDDSEITFGLELEICSERKLQGYSTGILCVYCLDLEPVVISQCQRFLGCPCWEPKIQATPQEGSWTFKIHLNTSMVSFLTLLRWTLRRGIGCDTFLPQARGIFGCQTALLTALCWLIGSLADLHHKVFKGRQRRNILKEALRCVIQYRSHKTQAGI